MWSDCRETTPCSSRSSGSGPLGSGGGTSGLRNPRQPVVQNHQIVGRRHVACSHPVQTDSRFSSPELLLPPPVYTSEERAPVPIAPLCGLIPRHRQLMQQPGEGKVQDPPPQGDLRGQEDHLAIMSSYESSASNYATLLAHLT